MFLLSLKLRGFGSRSSDTTVIVSCVRGTQKEPLAIFTDFEFKTVFALDLGPLKARRMKNVIFS